LPAAFAVVTSNDVRPNAPGGNFWLTLGETEARPERTLASVSNSDFAKFRLHYSREGTIASSVRSLRSDQLLIAEIRALAERHCRAFLTDLDALAPPRPAPGKAPITPQEEVAKLREKVRAAYGKKSDPGVKIKADDKLAIAKEVLTDDERATIYLAMRGRTSDEVKNAAKYFLLPVTSFYHLAYVGKSSKRQVSDSDIAEILRVGPTDEYITALRLGLNQGDVHFTLKKNGLTR
jgi:hypothetical protein